MEDWYESDSQRELRQIFQGQNHISQLINVLSSKLDEVVGRQERTLSLISQQAGAITHGQVPPSGGQAAPQAGGFIDTIRRHEVDAVFNNQNQLLNSVREIRYVPLNFDIFSS